LIGAGSFAAGLWAVGLFAERRLGEQRAGRAAAGETSMIANGMGAGPQEKRGQTPEEIEGIEDDFLRSSHPRTPELIHHLPVGAQGKAILGKRGTKGVSQQPLQSLPVVCRNRPGGMEGETGQVGVERLCRKVAVAGGPIESLQRGRTQTAGRLTDRGGKGLIERGQVRIESEPVASLLVGAGESIGAATGHALQKLFHLPRPRRWQRGAAQRAIGRRDEETVGKNGMNMDM